MKNPILAVFLIAIISYSCSPTSTDRAAKLRLENNKKLVTSFFEEVINNKNYEQYDKIFSQDYIQYSMDVNGKPSQGVKDGSNLKFIKHMLTGLPDLHYTIHDIIAEGDIVSANISGLATHQDKFMAMKLLATKFRTDYCIFIRFLMVRL